MSTRKLLPQDLTSFHEELSRATNPDALFAKVKSFYQNLTVNEQELERLEYAVNLLETQNGYEQHKEGFRNEHQQLKNIRQTIDDRILIVEQKLYLGIPDDLVEMERLISEQEAIVSDQEKLNDAELTLLDKMSQADISYGKKLAAIDQSQLNRDTPLQAKLEKQLEKVAEAEKTSIFRSKIISIVSVFIVPIILDYIVSRFGLNGTTNQLIFAHYVFLLSLIAFHVFFADEIRLKISLDFAKKHSKVFAGEISTALSELEKAKKRLETKHHITTDEVNSVLQK